MLMRYIMLKADRRALSIHSQVFAGIPESTALPTCISDGNSNRLLEETNKCNILNTSPKNYKTEIKILANPA